MSQPSKYPMFIYESKSINSYYPYKAIFFIKRNLWLVEDRNDNFELCSQISEKIYLTTKELNKSIAEKKYKLVLLNKEDDYLTYRDFVKKNVWHEEDSEDEEDEEDEE